jgi:GT2 family glycosyltransferase
MSVTIIIPTYNGEKYLASCLQSLNKQFYSDFEILIVDNCSKDKTINIARRYKTKIIIETENMGFTGACNTGIKCGDSDYLVFLNQDTIVHEHWLAELVNCAESLDADVVTSNILPINDYPNTNDFFGRPIWFWPHIPGLFFGELINGVLCNVNFVAGTAFLIKKKITNLFDYFFDERFFMYHEDIDLSIRLIAYDVRIAFTPKAIVWHDDGISAIAPYYVIRNLHPLIFKNFGVQFYLKFWSKLLWWNVLTAHNLQHSYSKKSFLKANFDGVCMLSKFRKELFGNKHLADKIATMIPIRTRKEITKSLKSKETSKLSIFHG